MKEKYSKIGDQNLKAIDNSNKFTDWLFDQIKSDIRGNILEIGSGVGTYSKKLIKKYGKDKVVLSDIDSEYLKNLKNEFKKTKILNLDLNKKPNLNLKFDTIIALNVLEHVKNDSDALMNLKKILKPNGNLILLVPAHKNLFNEIDKAVGHFRRYKKKELIKKSLKAGFEIKKVFYFNFLAIPAWYVNGNILKKAAISEGAMGFYNKLVPILRFTEEKILKKRVGISLIIILKND